MHNYVFIYALTMVAILVKRSRVPALFMLASYVVFVAFTLNIQNDKAYYMAVTIQEAILCTLFAIHYFKTNFTNSKYMAYMSFIGVINHIYGRIVYGYMLDTGIYIAVGLFVVSAQIILMLIRPIDDGIYRSPFRSCCLRFNSSVSDKPSSKMPVKVGKEEIK